MKKWSLGIRAQLTAGIVITTLAGIGLIGLLSIKIVENSAVYWKINEAGTIVSLIRSELRLPVYRDNPQWAAGIGVALKEAGINDFRLTDPSGRIIINEGTLLKTGESVSYSGEMEVRKPGGGWFKGAGEALFITADLPGKDGKGKIEFKLDLSGIREETAVARSFLILYALLDSAIIIILGVYFLSRSIMSPLKRLEEAATRIAGGKLYERARVSVDNEVGSLAVSFNRMAERLEDEIKSLERVNIELLSAQEELLRSSTLAAVGRLAAGIAHEIGNPLGAVRGYLDLLSRAGLSPEDEREIIERASREVTRIDSIVREFLEVARPSGRAASEIDVNALVQEAISTAAVRKDFEGVETVLLLNQAIPRVIMDEGKLRQVFMNLIINAAHSMSGREGSRVITVSTGVEKRASGRRVRRRKDDPSVESSVPQEKEFVFISFEDKGTGVSAEDLKRIFDPFFTTKEVGKGSGLGLFVSQSMIRNYGGEISLETKAAEGSVFTVSLPSGRDA